MTVINNDDHPNDRGLHAEVDDAWGELSSQMHYEKAVQDRKESDAGTRFYDTGTRIPGAQKGKNDTYMDRRK